MKVFRVPPTYKLETKGSFALGTCYSSLPDTAHPANRCARAACQHGAGARPAGCSRRETAERAASFPSQQSAGGPVWLRVHTAPGQGPLHPLHRLHEGL